MSVGFAPGLVGTGVKLMGNRHLLQYILDEGRHTWQRRIVQILKHLSFCRQRLRRSAASVRGVPSDKCKGAALLRGVQKRWYSRSDNWISKIRKDDELERLRLPSCRKRREHRVRRAKLRNSINKHVYIVRRCRGEIREFDDSGQVIGSW